MKKIASFLIALSIMSPTFADDWDVIFTDDVWFAVNRSTYSEISGMPTVWTVKGVLNDTFFLNENIYACNTYRSITLRSYFIEANGFTLIHSDKIQNDRPIPGTFLHKEAGLACGKINADFRLNVENTQDLPKRVQAYIGK